MCVKDELTLNNSECKFAKKTKIGFLQVDISNFTLEHAPGSF